MLSMKKNKPHCVIDFEFDVYVSEISSYSRCKKMNTTTRLVSKLIGIYPKYHDTLHEKKINPIAKSILKLISKILLMNMTLLVTRNEPQYKIDFENESIISMSQKCRDTLDGKQ